MIYTCRLPEAHQSLFLIIQRKITKKDGKSIVKK